MYRLRPLITRLVTGMADHSFFGIVIDFKIGFDFADLGGPGGPNLPFKLWGASLSTIWKVNWPTGAAGTPQINEIKADFEIYNEPKHEGSAIPITVPSCRWSVGLVARADDGAEPVQHFVVSSLVRHRVGFAGVCFGPY